MSEPLLIGTRGWQHADWGGAFYPPELPPEWRFCYYSNRLRAVLVPAQDWPGVTRDDVVQWVEDSDPLFRFVLETPALLWCAPPDALARFLDTIAPLDQQIAGLSLRPPAGASAAAVEALLAPLACAYPVCLDAPASPALLPLLRAHDVACAWRVGEDPPPAAGGRLLVAYMRAGDPRALRGAIETLAAWRGETGLAALFFEAPGAQAVQLAEQARTLAEIMVV